MKKALKKLIQWETVAVIFMLGSIINVILSEKPFEFMWLIAGLCVIMVGLNEVREKTPDIDKKLTKCDSQYEGMMTRTEIISLMEFAKGYSQFMENEPFENDIEEAMKIELIKENALIIATLETVLKID
jgi:hypothetical protein